VSDFEHTSLLSDREMSSFFLGVRTATTQAEAATILRENDVSEKEFLESFPGLVHAVQQLPPGPWIP